MGREIRKVPPGWKHPKDERGYQPMYDECFDDASREWDKNFLLWQEGKHPDQQDVATFLTSYEYWEGESPEPEYYRPAFKEEPTHYQIYETVSEGTPTSPVFATLEEMKQWLIGEGFSEYAAGEFTRTGYAPSMVFAPGRGISPVGVASLDWLQKDDDLE